MKHIPSVRFTAQNIKLCFPSFIPPFPNNRCKHSSTFYRSLKKKGGMFARDFLFRTCLRRWLQQEQGADSLSQSIKWPHFVIASLLGVLWKDRLSAEEHRRVKNKPTPPKLLLNTRTALLFFVWDKKQKKTNARRVRTWSVTLKSSIEQTRT